MSTTYELVDPNTVVIGDNVRLDPRLDDDQEFVASIKERGVIEPAVLYRGEGGVLTVFYGQRRTLAARMTGQPLPAVIHDDPPAEADRLVDQYVENEHRAALSNSERIGAIQQMTLAGLSDHQIAKKTATPKNVVKAARTVAQAPAMAEYADHLTLDQAAALVEFEDDAEAVEVLLNAAQEGRFEHAAQRIRNDQEDKAARAAFVAELAARGVPVIDEPSWQDPMVAFLRRLKDTEGNSITADAHASCPGHAAVLEVSVMNKNRVDDSDVTLHRSGQDPYWDDEVEEDDNQVYALRAQYVCTDFATHGHVDWWNQSSTPSRKRADDMSEDEREAARLERRNVIESNKAWKAATQVRRDWIASFATRKSAPDGAEAYLARVIVGGWGHESAGHDTLTLAGFPGRSDAAIWTLAHEQRQAAAEATTTASPKRALQIGLAVAVAMWEERTHPNTWRSPSSHDLDTLACLKNWGYATSEIEDRMLAAAQGSPNT